MIIDSHRRPEQGKFFLNILTKMKTNDISPSCFEALLKSLKADALFSATGGVDDKGAATIGDTLASINIPEGFASGYLPLAPHDVVGMLFAADPRIAERLSASQYGEIPATADSHVDLAKRLEIQAYLRKAGFEHLVLAGLRSTLYGMAWVVAYRGPMSEPFSDEELEIARYTVPGVLFNFLRDRAIKNGKAFAAPPVSATGALVPLDPYRLRVAILAAQGFGAGDIAAKVFRAEKTINNRLTDIRDRLGVEGRSITFLDLEHYAGRVVSRLAK